jgi:hypothetical protein
VPDILECFHIESGISHIQTAPKQFLCHWDLSSQRSLLFPCETESKAVFEQPPFHAKSPLFLFGKGKQLTVNVIHLPLQPFNGFYQAFAPYPQIIFL